MSTNGGSSLRGLRVALVLAGSTGGIGRHVASLGHGLVARGARVAVLGPPGSDDRFGFGARGAGFTPLDIPSALDPLAGTRAVMSLRATLRGADLVHAHGQRAGLVTGLALARRSRLPYVVSWHNPAPGRPGRGGGDPRIGPGSLESAVTAHLGAAAQHVTVRLADAVLGASLDLVERARAVGSANAVFVPVAAPPLPPPVRSAAEVRAELGAADRPIVLAVGRLESQKDYPTLLDAATHWASRAPVPMVAIAGEGPLRDEILDRVRAERLPVRLLGHREDVADLLGAADVVVLPSAWEARSLVAQEALHARRPLVATAVGGIPELVGGAALLVPPRDPIALGDAVTRVLDESGLAVRLAAAGASRAAGFPTEDDTAERVAQVYRDVLDG